MRYTTYLMGLLIALVLTACGGGGGSPGSSSNSQIGGGSGTTTAVATASIAVTIANASNQAVTSISLGGGFLARATLRDEAGALVTNRLVSFSLTDASIASITPATALTNASGVAEVAIAPTSITSLGAATLLATAVVGTNTVVSRLDFGVTSTNLALSTISLGSNNLISGGNTSVDVTALLNGVAASGTPVNVVFSATCGRINGAGATFSATTNGSGVASVVYTAVNADGTLCSGGVSITAASAGASSRTIGLNVAAPVANAIIFIAAQPAQIFIAGFGAPEQSLVGFRVMSGATALPNVQVTFSLPVAPGGAGLNAMGSTANVTATTNATGDVSVSVFSGSIPGPVRVRAALTANAAIFTESQNLTIASGPPSQRFMSLAIQTGNIEGQNIDGTSTRLTVRIADRQGNPVEDGTVINFTAEGGQVAPSCATARINGISLCSVDFVSQNPRPLGGRVSVLAYTEGTKDYTDVNSDNRFTQGIDTLVQIGDAYRDDNESNLFDSAFDAFRIPRGVSGGVGCAADRGGAFPFVANSCDDRLQTTVRQQAVILFASSTPFIGTPTMTVLDIPDTNADANGIPTTPVVVPGSTLVGTSRFTFNLRSNDNRLLPMPAGTTIAVAAVDAVTTDGQACAVGPFGPTTVSNVIPRPGFPREDLSTVHDIFFTQCVSGDSFRITVTAPSGTARSFTYSFP